MNKNYLQYKKLLHSARGIRMIVLFIVFFLLFGLLGATISGTYDQTVQKDKQLAVLEEDLKREQAKNEALKAQKEYYESNSYIEKEARDTLGLSYPNEQIYILKKDDGAVSASTDTKTEEKEDKVSQENIFSKWLNLIFG